MGRLTPARGVEIIMAVGCEKVRRLLDGYYDRQLHGRKFDAVSEHLHQCDACSGELEKLERMGRMLKEHYKGVAGAEDLSAVWARVDAATEAVLQHPPEPLLDRLVRIFSIPRPAGGAVALVAVVLVVALAYMPGDQTPPTLAANDCIIDSVDAEDCSVMVYEVGDSKMKIIWVMGQQPAATEEKA